jgi:hypothetical protein
MEVALSSAMLCTASALSATWRMLAVISWTEDAEVSTDWWRAPALRATSSIELLISSTDDETSSAAPERPWTSSSTRRMEVLRLTSRDAASSTASSWTSALVRISSKAVPMRSGTPRRDSSRSCARSAAISNDRHSRL